MEAMGQAELEYAQAPRITMAKSWDLKAYSEDLDSHMAHVPQSNEDSLEYSNEMMVRGTRSAAASQRVHRAEMRSEIREVVRGMVEVRNECRDAGQRMRQSKDIARARRRERLRRALASALRPRRQRGRASAGVPALRDVDGAPLPAP